MISVIDKELQDLNIRVKEGRTLKDNYVATVRNERESDFLYGSQLVFLFKKYGNTFFSPRPAFFNLTSMQFNAISDYALTIDKKLRESNKDKIFRETNTFLITAMYSKSNQENTVVHWTVINEDSPFIGLKFMTVVSNSKFKNKKYVIADRKDNRMYGINNPKFYRSEKIENRWINMMIDKYDAIGYLMQNNIVKYAKEILESRLETVDY